MFREDVKIKKTAERMKTVSLFTNDEKHEKGIAFYHFIQPKYHNINLGEVANCLYWLFDLSS